MKYTHQYLKGLLRECHPSIVDLLISEGLVERLSEPKEAKLTLASVRNHRADILKFLANRFGMKHHKYPRGQLNFWILRGFSEEEAESRYKNFSGCYDSYSCEAIMKRHNCTEDEARKIQETRNAQREETLSKYTKEEINAINKRKSTSLEKTIERFGEEKGREKYKKRIEKYQYSVSREGMLERFGKDADRIIEERNRQRSSSLERCVERYGIEEGTRRYKEQRLKKSKSHTLKGYIERYGLNDGYDKFKEQKCEKMKFRASLASLEVFLPLYDILCFRGYDENDIHFGYEDKREYFLIADGKFYSYDFTIKSLNLIIEFNGIKFHPKSPDANWVNPLTPSVLAEEKFEYDRKKCLVAEKNGFKVITVWDDVTPTENLKIILNEIDILEESVLKLENHQN